MPEDFELFGGSPQGKEKTGESQEKFQERHRQAQAAIKQIKKEEQRKKQDDNLLADIVVRFLNEPKHARHFLLISRLVARNMPSDLVIAIIALIYSPAREHIENKFGEGNLKIEAPKGGNFSADAKIALNAWMNGMNSVAMAEPHMVLETGLDREKKIHFILVQFTTVCMQEFLESQQKEDVNFENIQSFCGTFWQNLFTRIAEQVENQNLLAKPEGVPDIAEENVDLDNED